MIYTSRIGYKGEMKFCDVSNSTKSNIGLKLSKANYIETINKDKEIMSRLIDIHIDHNIVFVCDCKGNCHIESLAKTLEKQYYFKYGGRIGTNDENINQNLDKLELEPNIKSVVFEGLGRMNQQVQHEISEVWKNQSIKTANDCLREYEEFNDNYKISLDIPTPQAMVDMGCSDNGYLELKTIDIRTDHRLCCKSDLYLESPDLKNFQAGRMDLCHFTELCVPIKDRLYRLEMKTGRELPKYRDINWLSEKIGCTLGEADLFNKAFIDLELGKNEIYKIIFGYFNQSQLVKKNGIQNTGNKELYMFLNLQEEMSSLKLQKEDINFNRYDENGVDVEEEYKENIQDEDLIELNFKEDLPVDSNIFTLKRLSIPEESLSEEEIAAIKYATYDEYKEILSTYMEKKKVCVSNVGKRKVFRKIGKKIDGVKTKTAISMAWIYLNEKKEEFKSVKDILVKETLKIGLTETTYNAIEAYKERPSKSNRYRVLISIHGGEWDGIKIPKASKGEAEVAWRVLNGKL